MINNNHVIEIFVDKQKIDIKNQKSLNLRINSIIFNPTELTSKQAEYSFSFNVPATQNNNMIFNHINDFAKINKYNKNYNGEVYADGILIFQGTFRIKSYANNEYKCNILSIKLNTLQDIFNESKLNEIDWYIPFEGANSINSHNNNILDGKVYFPFVSYGAFQKSPISKTGTFNNYTSKFEIDKYNRWFIESFSPSLNLVETVKRCFEYKGYKVSGDIFDDEVVNNIYMSTNLADNQIPTYNLGNDKFGRVTLRTVYYNYQSNASHTDVFGFQHNMTYPLQNVLSRSADGYWNWESIGIHDLLASDTANVTTDTSQQYMFDEDDNVIVIPSDGLYKISLTSVTTLMNEYDGNNMTVDEKYITRSSASQGEVLHRDATFRKELKERTPVEIQLLRNSDTTELIRGSQCIDYTNGTTTGNDVLRNTWYCAYPHEDLRGNTNPTTSTSLYTKTTSSDSSRRPSAISGSSRREVATRSGGVQSEGNQGFVTKEGELFAYDPYVNPNFICGVSSWGQCPSVIKNGYSWNPSESVKINSRYNQQGYWSLNKDGRNNYTYTWTATDYNKLELKDTTSGYANFKLQDTQFNAGVNCIVELKKDDILSLKAITREYEDKNGKRLSYKFQTIVNLDIQAYSPKDITSLETENRGWNSLTQFDVDLRVSNFLNKEKTMYDFVNNFIKEFNLSYEQIGNEVILNKQTFNINNIKYAVNLDDRTNRDDGESSRIDYPSSLEVKYNIDTEEWGFERTVPDEHINDANWSDYGDFGSDVIPLDESGDAEKEEVNLNTSYTYYDTFYKLVYNSDGSIQYRIPLRIPVISKFSYMIDGYSYEESMKVDGKGLPLRYWFRQKNTDNTVFLTNGDYVYLTLPTNTYMDTELSYKNNDESLLNYFYNVTPYLSSNYVTIKCYLSPIEYKSLKNGANVIWDDDVYIVNELNGYDPTGNNTTEIIMMKKI